MKQLNLGNSAKKGEALEELQREVRIMSALSHPNIVNLRVRHSSDPRHRNQHVHTNTHNTHTRCA